MLEKNLHSSVCKWLKLQYPGILFRTDYAAGMRLSIGMAMRQKTLQSHKGYPDLFIIEPRGSYAGLFIELKTETTKIFKKNGELISNPHIEEQHKMLEMLKDRGFVAEFGIGFDDIIAKIKTYLEIH